MRPATIRDVAKKAGVGLGTVSRVINGSPSVSEETRQRVLAAIDELDYVPSPTARRLSLGKTLTIGVIVPFFTRPSVTERLRGIESTLANSDYDLLIYNVESIERRDECIRNVPRRERVDGVMIISVLPGDEDILSLTEVDVPIVLVDANHPSLSALNRVVVDDVEGGQIATQHLIDLGHRQIGYISDILKSPFNHTSSRDRFWGYQRALEANGIPFRPEFHLQGPHSRLVAYELALKMLSMPDRPTAIFAASDTQAMGVIQAAGELGLTIPEHLSVIGYDDVDIADYLGLTTIRQLLFESGQRGVELMLHILARPKTKPVEVLLPTELVIRKTTAPPQ